MPLLAYLKLCFDTDHLLCQAYSTYPCTHSTLLRQEELLREFHDVCEYLGLTAYHMAHFLQRPLPRCIFLSPIITLMRTPT